MEPENKKLLIQGAKTLGIDLGERTVEAFDLYLRELLKWNRKINLTAIRSEKEIVVKHFIDSLAVVPHLSKVTSLLDIGSGAGFPGVPLKMIQPTLEVTLLDSVLKKVDFQSHIIRTLELKGIIAIHGRAQDKEILERLAGRFDGVIARAFSDLEHLLWISFPFLKKGGLLIAMKGREREDLSLIEKPPYQLQKMVQYSLPFSSIKRSLLLFEKI